jgi:5-methylcytosine-specific restriction protein A
MMRSAQLLADWISLETGLRFDGIAGADLDGARWYEIRPSGYPPTQTFAIRAVLGWRRLDVYFRPGSFSAELVHAMGLADEAGRRAFRAVLAGCVDDGADVVLAVNGAGVSVDDAEVWGTTWRNLDLAIRRGMLDVSSVDGPDGVDFDSVRLWTSRLAAAVLALLPLEGDALVNTQISEDILGLPEGAKASLVVNAYERDRRNRAAALAVHGFSCKACGLALHQRYGSLASGIIEVHHVVPVSQLGSDYVLDPRVDLVPLCPNCHAVAHRRNPPFTVDELRNMIESSTHA